MYNKNDTHITFTRNNCVGKSCKKSGILYELLGTYTYKVSEEMIILENKYKKYLYRVPTPEFRLEGR